MYNILQMDIPYSREVLAAMLWNKRSYGITMLFRKLTRQRAAHQTGPGSNLTFAHFLAFSHRN